MKKYLFHEWTSQGIKEFDIETSVVHNIVENEKEKVDFGFVWRQNCKWFAFYKEDNIFILQNKNFICRSDSNYSLSLKNIFKIFRCFQIYENNRLIFTIRYIPRWFFMSLIDPSYDSIDSECDDFFFYVFNMWYK